jgi:hypothetical protein
MHTIMLEYIKKLVDRTVHSIEENIKRTHLYLLTVKQKYLIIILV